MAGISGMDFTEKFQAIEKKINRKRKINERASRYELWKAKLWKEVPANQMDLAIDGTSTIDLRRRETQQLLRRYSIPAKKERCGTDKLEDMQSKDAKSLEHSDQQDAKSLETFRVLSSWRKRPTTDLIKWTNVGVKGQNEHRQTQAFTFGLGELVWGKLKGFSWWPGKVVSHLDIQKPVAELNQRWIHWFGEDNISLIASNRANRAIKNAEDLGFQEENDKVSSDIDDSCTIQTYKMKECKKLIQWAKDNFPPGGPKSLEPSTEERLPLHYPGTSESSDDEDDEDDYDVNKKQQVYIKTVRKREINRTAVVKEISEGKKQLKDVCLVCADDSLATEHPLFEGGLCETCRINFLECAFLYDEDGYRSFCTVCSDGSKLLMCSSDGCYHAFCTQCVDIMVGPGTFEKEEKNKSWICYMCSPENEHGLLQCRNNWRHKLYAMMNADTNRYSSDYKFIFPIPLIQDKKPMKVLSLFDGISSVSVILDQLGVKVDHYYASEVNPIAITIASAQQCISTVTHVPGITEITEELLSEWGHIDLLVAGSRHNEISYTKTNPPIEFDDSLEYFHLCPSASRMHEFYRILRFFHRHRDKSRPFFWLFESEADIVDEDKELISCFLKVDPVLVDAVYVSAIKAKRYYWGNLPGMLRSGFKKLWYQQTLQDFIKCHTPQSRKARFAQIKKITTMSSSKKPGMKDLPVKYGDKYDELWSTELEGLFGFPKHYAHVSPLTQQMIQTQLCESWSLRIVKSLLEPVKEYYAYDMVRNN
ncbi:DNA (cytosine-5)-methyltransferase 3A-like isoform X2 [Ptychodera flava]|uniref:DNA (cytosine-5)-methyltransferase 3A-like isoform X2 n=1 Tax=Ptychodera flava TaxID=63121 RepID=UPI00396A8F3D